MTDEFEAFEWKLARTVPQFLTFGDGRGYIGGARSDDGELVGIVLCQNHGGEPGEIGAPVTSDTQPDTYVVFKNRAAVAAMRRAVEYAERFFDERDGKDADK